MFLEQQQKMANGHGFIAALDHSRGSTPKALARFGVPENAWSSDEEMFNLIHALRTRIITSPVFTGDRLLATILFEQTMDRQVAGIDTPHYLWHHKGIVPFVKVDRGLAPLQDGVQLMNPMPDLSELCTRAITKKVFGTKMRSVIKAMNPTGISLAVAQQFELASQIAALGLTPIIEPEVAIDAVDKSAIEAILVEKLLVHLDSWTGQRQVILKLTLPSIDNFYSDLMCHPQVLRVVALSGGYTRAQSISLLARNNGLIASFSRALTEGLTANQSDEEFNAKLDASIESIYRASLT